MSLPSFAGNGATATGTISLLLIDPHTAFRQALAILLTQGSRATVICHAGTLEEGRCAVAGADCVVAALDFADQPSMTFLHEMRVRRPQRPILVLTHSSGRPPMLPDCKGCGLEVLPASAGGEEVLCAVRRLCGLSFTA